MEYRHESACVKLFMDIVCCISCMLLCVCHSSTGLSVREAKSRERVFDVFVRERENDECFDEPSRLTARLVTSSLCMSVLSCVCTARCVYTHVSSLWRVQATQPRPR